MKKSLLTVVLGALVLSTANANWYAEADSGISKTKFTSYADLNKTSRCCGV